MAFNFNDDPPGVRLESDPVTPPGAEPGGTTGAASGDATPAVPVAITSDNPQSAAFARFASCRWQQPAEDGNAAFCTHREVKPYAGTTGFDPDAWCPECQYYKLRRAPKKRTPQDEYSY